MFKNYIDLIGSYSVYLNTTLLSPMPRSRGEAMMAGLVTVNANSHDVDMFVKHGDNGFISNDPKEISGILKWLIDNPTQRIKMNGKSRATATKTFHINRYLEDWKQTLKEVI